MNYEPETLMSEEEFGYSSQPLRDTYGVNNYPMERMRILYKALKLITREDYEGVVRKVLLEHMRAPSPRQILDAAKPEISSRLEAFYKNAKLENDKNPCYKCKGSGWLMAFEKKNIKCNGQSFICGCPVSRVFISKNKNTVYWKDEFISTHDPEYLYPGKTQTEVYFISKFEAFSKVAEDLGIDLAELDKYNAENIAIKINKKIESLSENEKIEFAHRKDKKYETWSQGIYPRE